MGPDPAAKGAELKRCGYSFTASTYRGGSGNLNSGDKWIFDL